MAEAWLRVPVSVAGRSDAFDIEDWELFLVLRRKWNIKQEAVARAAGLSQPTVSGWERGRRSGVPEEQLWSALFNLVEEAAGADADAGSEPAA